MIHEEDNIIKRSLRDYLIYIFDEIIINDKETLKSKEFVKQFIPSSLNLKIIQRKKPLFAAHQIESKIMDINNPIVHMMEVLVIKSKLKLW